LISRRLQPPLPLVTALEEIPNAKVKLLDFVQIVASKVLGTEKREKLAIG